MSRPAVPRLSPSANQALSRPTRCAGLGRRHTRPAAADRRPPGRRSRWRRSLFGFGGLRILGAVAGGLAVYAAFAPSTWWWSAILGFALFGLALDGRGWKAGAGLGFVFGLAFFLPLLSFTNIYVGDFPWYALSVMEALLTAPAGALIAVATRRLPLWPMLGGGGLDDR